MLRERESKDSFHGPWGVHVGSPYQTPSLKFIVKLRQGSGKDRQGMVKGERPKSLEPCLELTLNLVLHHIPASSGTSIRNRLLNSQIKSIHSSTKCLGKGNLKKVSIACRVGREGHHTPSPPKIYCEAQGKGRAKGWLRKVTKRSFIDYRWWMVDILSLMLYTKFGCVTFPPPPPGSLLIS